MQRVNKRPIMSDLKESGQIEADCDLVLFPYYDFLFNPDSDCGNFAEIIIGKNRHGGSETSYAKVINGVWLDCDQQEARNRLSA
jgi:replicative DNA helicase